MYLFIYDIILAGTTVVGRTQPIGGGGGGGLQVFTSPRRCASAMSRLKIVTTVPHWKGTSGATLIGPNWSQLWSLPHWHSQPPWKHLGLCSFTKLPTSCLTRLHTEVRYITCLAGFTRVTKREPSVSNDEWPNKKVSKVVHESNFTHKSHKCKKKLTIVISKM